MPDRSDARPPETAAPNRIGEDEGLAVEKDDVGEALGKALEKVTKTPPQPSGRPIDEDPTQRG